MKISVPNLLLPLAGLSFLAASPCAAQVAIEPSPAVPSPQLEFGATRKRMQQIRLRSVKPSLMAFWLDPKNHDLPHEGGSQSAADLSGIRANFTLPEGIDRIVAIDPQMALLVFGTDAGVAELRDTIAFLDRPQRTTQIAVDARLIAIQSDKLRGIWANLADLAARNAGNAPIVVFLRPDESGLLTEQLKNREAQLLRIGGYTLESGASAQLDFGPPSQATAKTPDGRWWPDFHSDMPVFNPPDTGDMKNFPPRMQLVPRVPAPLDGLKLHMTPRLEIDNSISLDLQSETGSPLLGGGTRMKFSFRGANVLVFALPDSTPGTNAFLLLGVNSVRRSTEAKIPLLRDLPGIGGLFRLPKKPDQTPQIIP